MKHAVFSLALLSATLILNACSVTDPERPKYDYEGAQREAQQKKEDRARTAASYKGGQPGKIQISGAVVRDEGTLDSRITVHSMTGTSGDWTHPEIEKEKAPKYSISFQGRDLPRLRNDSNLIAIGCDETEVSALAKERGLKVESLAKEANGFWITISANTVVACGKLELPQRSITFVANEIILKSARFEQTWVVNDLSIVTNKLHLVGSSQIRMDGQSPARIPPGNIELHVRDEVTSEANGTLVLSSEGLPNPYYEN